jgi:hypothetical protein
MVKQDLSMVKQLFYCFIKIVKLMATSPFF